MDSDELEIDLRSPGAVAHRMVLLAAFARWAIALADDEAEERQVAAEIADLRDALRIGPFEHDLAPRERALVGGRRMTEADVLSLSWQTEALAALVWATGLEARLPPPWRPAELPTLIGSIPDPWDDLDAFIASLILRDEETIAAERERAELWLWRAATAEELAGASAQERRRIERTIRDVAEEADAAGLIPGLNGDLRVERLPFVEIDEETVALIAEVAAQRLHALNWMCGYGSTWDAVPLDL